MSLTTYRGVNLGQSPEDYMGAVVASCPPGQVMYTDRSGCWDPCEPYPVHPLLDNCRVPEDYGGDGWCYPDEYACEEQRFQQGATVCFDAYGQPCDPRSKYDCFCESAQQLKGGRPAGRAALSRVARTRGTALKREAGKRSARVLATPSKKPLRAVTSLRSTRAF